MIQEAQALPRSRDIVALDGRCCGASMIKPREARHVPDLSVGGIVVVGVELSLREQVAARGAAVIVLAAAVHRHDLAEAVRGRVKTASTPLAARHAALEAARVRPATVVQCVSLAVVIPRPPS